MATKKKVATRRAATTQPRAGYDEGLAERIRGLLGERSDTVEKKMFGGLCFLVGGRMCCGITREAFMVRVGTEAFDDALAQPHARVMDFTGRASRASVYVDPPGYRTDAQLEKWIARGLALATGQPSRPKSKRG